MAHLGQVDSDLTLAVRSSLGHWFDCLIAFIIRSTRHPTAKPGGNAVPHIKLPMLFTLATALLVNQAHAEGLFPVHRISAELASQAAAEAVATCAKRGYAETAVVVDADGVRQAVLRGDRAGSHTLDSAFDKAYTAASFKTDTSALFERSKSVPGFANLFTQLPHLMLFGGGIVIKVGDEVVGAIGAAGAPGANLDDDCARAGLDKIRDQLK
jgi:uncharacterized protein GlcG (DUF336 family)